MIASIKQQKNNQLEALLNSTRSREVTDGVLVLGFASDVLKSKMDHPEMLEATRLALREFLGADVPGENDCGQPGREDRAERSQSRRDGRGGARERRRDRGHPITDKLIQEIIKMAKGFNKTAGAGGNPMMAQLQRLQQQMAEAQEKLKIETVTATAGGGAIKVTMTGDQVCKGVEIDPDFLKDADAEMLNDMVLTAVNLALDKSRELQQQMMGPLASGLPF